MIADSPPTSKTRIDPPELEELTETAAGISKLNPPPNPSHFQFVREDWTLFRSLPTLGQKAGVSVDRLPGLVLKELVDNALDAVGHCEITQTDDGSFRIEDRGPGLPPGSVPDLFSIRRQLSSSKLLRLPTRGAMGNGLRVVAGAVLATAGALTVWTRGQRIELHPQDDGSTQADYAEAPHFTAGMRVEIRLGIDGADPMRWAWAAIEMAKGECVYTGKTSPHWYGPVAFFELCQAAGAHTVRELIEQFDGCTGAKAGTIARPFKGRAADSLSRNEALQLLLAARRHARPVPARRLGRIGPDLDPDAGYARAEGAFTHEFDCNGNGTGASIPFTVEAWATPGRDGLQVCVNRTPITGDVEAYHTSRDKTCLSVFGCGLSHALRVGREPLTLLVNITTPYMPITTDGKEPDLRLFLDAIAEASEKAARRAKRHRQKPGERPQTQRDIIKANLPAACAKASGNGAYRFSIRQLFYAVRPHIIDATGDEPAYDYFSQVVGDYESQQGSIEGMYRDPRGILYHPHTGEEIPLGTIEVENYRRPQWTFNKILYCEKEGFISILRESKWPERNDCALTTSKGQASRAVKDVLDLLGEDGEPLKFFCIHDADAAGTIIYQALQGETKARPGRKVTIINLGLEPAEAEEMGLAPEHVQSKGRRPVADYVPAEWKTWLQRNRYELNAMTTPQFIAWLDAKMRSHAGKVIPPVAVLAETLAENVADAIRERLTEQAIREAKIDERTAKAVADLAPKLRKVQRGLAARVKADLSRTPDRRWTSPVADVAAEMVADRGDE